MLRSWSKGVIVKNKIKANSKLIQGGILYLKGKITGSRLDRLKGISKIIDGKTRLKVNRLVKLRGIL